MIQVQTMLQVADNTGARRLMCIRVLGGAAVCQRGRHHHLFR